MTNMHGLAFSLQRHRDSAYLGYLPQLSARGVNPIQNNPYPQNSLLSASPMNANKILVAPPQNRMPVILSPIRIDPRASNTPLDSFIAPPSERFLSNQSDSSFGSPSPTFNSRSQLLPSIQLPNTSLLRDRSPDSQNPSPMNNRASMILPLGAQKNIAFVQAASSLLFQPTREESQAQKIILQNSKPQTDKALNLTKNFMMLQRAEEKLIRDRSTPNLIENDPIIQKSNLNLIKSSDSRRFTDVGPTRLRGMDKSPRININHFDEYNLKSTTNLTDFAKGDEFSVSIENTTRFETPTPKPKSSILNDYKINVDKSALERIGKLYLKGELPTVLSQSIKKPVAGRKLKKHLAVTDSVREQSLSELDTDEERGNDIEEENEDDISISDENSVEGDYKMKSPKKISKENKLTRERKYLQVRRGTTERNYVSGLSNSELGILKVNAREKSESKILKNEKSWQIDTPKKTKLQKSVRFIEETDRKTKKKDKIRTKLRNLIWAVVYPSILTKDIEKRVVQRKKEILISITDYLPTIFKNAQNFIVSIGEKYLRNLVFETKSLELISLKKPISDKALDVRVNFIYTNLHKFFDKLIVRTIQGNFPNDLLKFLTSISQDYGVVPQNFLFDFELRRLQFNHYGNLKNMSARKSKMIIGSFILLRVLLHTIIMRPWTVFPDLNEKKVNKKNLLTIGSILYYLILNFYKRTVAIQHNNQSFIDPSLRVNARKELLKAFDEEPDWDERDLFKQQGSLLNKDKENEGVFAGFLPMDQLKAFFSDRKKTADQIKAFIEGWHDKVYELIQENYARMPKKDIGNLVFGTEKQQDCDSDEVTN